MVERFHGEHAALSAHKAFEKVFRDREIPEDIEVVKLRKEEVEKWLPKLLLNMGMVPSTTEGKRMIAQGGVSINGDKVTDEDISFEGAGEIILKVGKRKFKKIVLE